MRTLKFEDVCNGSKKIGLSKVRSLCLDEWILLWLNVQFGENGETDISDYECEGTKDRMVKIAMSAFFQFEREYNLKV